MIETPIYYAGKKEKLLEQILPNFPETTETFFDIFSGSCSIGINYGNNCEEVLFIDNCTQLQDVISLIKYVRFDMLKENVLKIIKDNGGLKDKDTYIQYRSKVQYSYSPLDLLVLTTVCFNNQMRFNKKGGFNSPFGERYSVESMLKKLEQFSLEIQKNKYHILNKDFSDIINLIIYSKDPFVYLDPPYLGSVATYNSGWENKHELELYDFLKQLDDAGVKFCMSNNKNYNYMLKEIESKYEIVDLDWNYNSCSYHKKNRKQNTGEILIKNY